MSSRETLHDLVDQLPDAEVARALRVLRALLPCDEAAEVRAAINTAQDKVRNESTVAKPQTPTVGLVLGRGNYSELARQTDLSTSHISRILRGLAEPSLSAASRIAKVAGMTIEEFEAHLASLDGRVPVRSGRNTDNPNAKLDRTQAREIRLAVKEGISQKDLAAEYGVSKQAISNIVRGISYS